MGGNPSALVHLLIQLTSCTLLIGKWITDDTFSIVGSTIVFICSTRLLYCHTFSVIQSDLSKILLPLLLLLFLEAVRMQDVALLPCTRNKDGKVPSYHSRIKKAYSASLNSPCAYSPARLNFLAASTTISILSDFLSVPAAQFSTMARDARRTLSGPYKNSTCHASYMICSPSLSQLPPHGLFCWT